MGRALPLRGDFDASTLRRLAKGLRDAKQIRRLLSLAVIYEGGNQTAAARTGDVGLHVIRDWVLRFNAVGPADLIDRKAPGAAKKLDPAQQAALAARVDAGPDLARDGMVRWRLAGLVDWIDEAFGVTLDARTGEPGDEDDGLCPDDDAATPPCPRGRYHRGLQKELPELVAQARQALSDRTGIEIWWQDEARVGQKNKYARR